MTAFLDEKTRNLGLIVLVSRLQQSLEASERTNREAAEELASVQERLRLKLAPREGPPEPFLMMSALRLFRFRSYSVTLVMPRGWLAAHRMTTDTLRTAVAGGLMTCRMEADPDRAASCSVCKPHQEDEAAGSGVRPLVEVTSSDRVALKVRQFGAGWESVTWDRCRTNCSSSKQHLRGAGVFLVLSLPGVPRQIRSQCFALMSRAAKATKSSVVAPTPVATGTNTPHPPARQFATVTTSQVRRLISPTPLANQRALAVMSVRLHATCLRPSDVEMMMSHYRDLMLSVPGCLACSTRMVSGIFAVFVTLTDMRVALKVRELSLAWAENRDGMRNPFNQTLYGIGGTRPLLGFLTGGLPRKPPPSSS